MRRWTGIVSTGQGRCSTTTGVFPPGWIQGSLNLRPLHRPLRLPHAPPEGWESVRWMPTMHAGSVGGIEVVIGLGNGDLAEIAARVHLRTVLGLTDGDHVEVVVP